LVFDVAAIATGEAAINVIGRASFTASGALAAPTDQNLGYPEGLAYDSTHKRLFVADSGFNRVMVFHVHPLFNHPLASQVLCQGDFTFQTTSANPTGCDSPKGVVYNGTTDTLYVADSDNNRISVFSPADPGSISSGMPSSVTLGQLAPPAKFGAVSQTRVFDPLGLALGSSGNLLYVADSANHRVMAFDVATATLTEPADEMLGQYDETNYSSPLVKYDKGGESNGPNQFGFSTGSARVAVDSVHRRLFACDVNNGRVLVYNLDDQNRLTNKVPFAVLGQADFASRVQGATQSGMSTPASAVYDSVNDRLFVSDSANNRVLVYDTASINSGENAAFVLGQPDFTSNLAAPSQSRLADPTYLALDEGNQRLFVASGGYNRVVVFDVASVSNGENAIGVLGQPDFTTISAEVSASKLSETQGVAFDAAGQRLFVADFGANRVLVYDVATVTNGEAASGVLCQSDFTSSAAATTNSSCSGPVGLAYDSATSALYVADSLNDRVLSFDVSNVSNGEAATAVLGQTDFVSVGTELTKFKFTPAGLTWDSVTRRLYVTDSAFHRVLVFPTRYAFTYGGTAFSEAAANDGSIGTTISVSLQGDTFGTWLGTLTRDVEYTITGVPAGLTEVITMNSSSSATISFTGAATAHEAANTVPAVTLTFLNPALSSVPASQVAGNVTSFAINFTNAPTPTPTATATPTLVTPPSPTEPPIANPTATATPSSSLCFGGVLPAPRVTVSRRRPSVQLPAGILPSAACRIVGKASLIRGKRVLSRAYGSGRKAVTLSTLSRGSWRFSYEVTTTALGTTNRSQLRTVNVK
jgi:DNA-binding beta-propeller fold protein YncE